MNHIPLNRIPRTLQQAIQVTVAMGFVNLWIDAICIIQDSKEDKDLEIPSMDRVYQNAVFTIFAACADSTAEGFSKQRDPWWIKPCLIHYRTTTRHYDYHHQRYISFHKDGFVDEGPLFQRGWVVQEQILSRRCLIFAQSGISWICFSGQASESHPKLRKDESEVPLYKWRRGTFDYDWFEPLRLALVRNELRDTEVDPMKRDQYSSHFDNWYEMVMKYSIFRDLTNNTDAINALRGVANAFASKYSCTFYQGLWIEDLQEGLSWHVERVPVHPGNTHTQTLNESLFPSWSWASRKGEAIQFPIGDQHSKTDRDCGLSVSPTFSQQIWNSGTSSGRKIIVCGRSRKAHISSGDFDWGENSVEGSIPISPFSPLAQNSSGSCV
jgi:hypothetical protein